MGIHSPFIPFCLRGNYYGSRGRLKHRLQPSFSLRRGARKSLGEKRFYERNTKWRNTEFQRQYPGEGSQRGVAGRPAGQWKACIVPFWMKNMSKDQQGKVGRQVPWPNRAGRPNIQALVQTPSFPNRMEVQSKHNSNLRTLRWFVLVSGSFLSKEEECANGPRLMG